MYLKRMKTKMKASECSRVSDPETNEEYEVFLDQFHYTLFGGGQLTVECPTGSKFHSNNKRRGVYRLEGLSYKTGTRRFAFEKLKIWYINKHT